MLRSNRLVKKRKSYENKYKPIEIVYTPTPGVKQTSSNPQDSSSFRATYSSSKTKVASSLLLYKQEYNDFEKIIHLKTLESTYSVAVGKIYYCNIKINKKQLAGLAL